MTSSLVGSEMCIRDSGLKLLIGSWKPCSGTGPAGAGSLKLLMGSPDPAVASLVFLSTSSAAAVDLSP
eukprot:9807339-Prorocentrum_lima.AAC.1